MPILNARPIHRLAIMAVALLLAVAAPTQAGLIFKMQSVTASAGSQGNSFDVLLQNTGSSAVTIAGFSFSLSSSTAIHFTDVTTATAAPNSYLLAGHSLFPDITDSAGAGAVSASDNDATPNTGISLVGGSTVGLGHVFFDVVPGASGVIVINFNSYPSTGLSDPGGSNIPITTLTPGAITIASVPEPSSLILLGIGLLGLATTLRRRAGSSPQQGTITTKRGRPERLV